MIKEKEEDSLDLMVRVSWLYYKEDLTQKKVGEQLNISRQKVQRLLDKARDMGIVQISINHPDVNLLNLEKALIKKHNLDDAVVVPSAKNQDGLLQSLGHASASFIERYLDKHDIRSIGIGWGQTMRAFADNYDSNDSEREIEIVSLVGHLLQNTAVNPYNIARTISEKMSCECYDLWAPAIIESEERTKVFRSEPWIKMTLQKAEEADLYIYSVGQISLEATLYQLDFLSSTEIQSLREQGAVGDILTQFFTSEGEILKTELQKRVIAMPIETLREEDNTTVCIAGGQPKVSAINGALEGNFIDILIVDETAANSLLGK